MVKAISYSCLCLALFHNTTVTGKNLQIHSEGFSVKTDFLDCMNSVIDKEKKEYFATAEWYFNNQYSLSANGLRGEEISYGFNRSTRSVGLEFRWYFKQDSCYCSSFFAGTIMSYINERQSIDRQKLYNRSESYIFNYFRTGITAGYQVYVTHHFLLDPALNFLVDINGNKLDSQTFYTEESNLHGGLQLEIRLGIGYRF